MVHRCCVSGCGMNVRVLEAKGHSFHSFPLKEPIREKWLQAVLPHTEKPETFKVVQGYTRICSRHFRPKDFKESKKRVRLSSTAIPSVFPRRSLTGVQDISQLNEGRAKNSQEFQEGENPEISTVPESTNGSQNTSSPDIDIATKGNSQSGGAISPASESNTTSNCLEPGKVRKRKKNPSSITGQVQGSRKKPSSPSQLPEETPNNITIAGEPLVGISMPTLLVPDETANKTEYSGNFSTEINHIGAETNHAIAGTPVTLIIDKDQLENLQVLNTNGELCKLQLVTVKNEPSELPVDPIDSLLDGNFGEFKAPPTPEALIDDLVSGGTNLSLNDSSLSPFDNHDLVEALQSATEDNAFAEDIDKLARDLTLSLLTNESSHHPDSELSLGGISDFDCSSLQSSLGINFSDDILDPTLDMFLSRPILSENDMKKEVTTESDSSEELFKDLFIQSDNSSVIQPESKGVKRNSAPPKQGARKIHKTDKRAPFSFAKFCHEDKDIEYYTGFDSAKCFEAFFESLESYISKLKVTDMMYSVNNIGKEDENELSDVSSTSDPSSSRVVRRRRKPKTAKGRALSRIDELFMTIVRLKRKLPEKVIGHIFDISQSSVSRIVRAWTMLLFKILESPTSEQLLQESFGNIKRAQDPDASNGPGSSTSSFQIPNSFRNLFKSELAQDIVGPAVIKAKKNNSPSSKNYSSKRLRKEKCDFHEMKDFNDSMLPVISVKTEPT